MQGSFKPQNGYQTSGIGLSYQRSADVMAVSASRCATNG